MGAKVNRRILESLPIIKDFVAEYDLDAIFLVCSLLEYGRKTREDNKFSNRFSYCLTFHHNPHACTAIKALKKYFFVKRS